MSKYLSYDDVLLVPNYSELESRSLADTSVNLCGFNFKLPVVPANMSSVINLDNARYLSNNGYFYIMHRYMHDVDRFVYLANSEKWPLVSISTGVNYDTLRILEFCKSENWKIDFITIDVAQGNHKKVEIRIKWIKDNLPNTKVIAGNIATYDAYRNLVQWGADVVKAGIGQGSICTTRFQTGFSVPMFSCIKDIVNGKNLSLNNYYQRKSELDADKLHIEHGEKYFKANYGEWKEFVWKNLNDIKNKIQKLEYGLDVPIIADGGTNYIGDIAKALVAGATMVMSGKLFAECIDSPAEIKNGKKQYFGSTSFQAKKENKHVEGRSIEIEESVTYEERLREIKEALQSSISYAGGNSLDSFKNVSYIEV
jgi:GMP reductase